VAQTHPVALATRRHVDIFLFLGSVTAGIDCPAGSNKAGRRSHLRARVRTKSSVIAHAKTFDEALRNCACRIIPGTERAIDINLLSGGASLETWSFRANGPNVDRPLILRRHSANANEPTRLNLGIEAQLMHAAQAAGVPSPTVLHVLGPDDGLGSGFIMDRVAGETIPRKILREEAFAAIRPALARQAGAILARIHAISTATLPPLPLSSARRELRELREIYRRDGQPRPVFELAFHWLKDHAPSDPVRPCLVHGDFRNGNLIIGPDGIRAVLDWELATFGDPMRDLGWICTPSWRFGEIDKPVAGFGTRADLIAGYETAGGTPVSSQALAYWEVFGSLRWGVYCLKMLARASTGDRPVERLMIARRASETEIDLLRFIAPRGT
jgi:aminoglycoside phosphotransferase (APT) family kinase protein